MNAETAVKPPATDPLEPTDLLGHQPWPEVEDQLKAGLRNHWYALILSRELVGTKPVALKRLDEELVLWRDGDGRPHLFRDACAHRGAKLSMGHVVDGNLACCYHGWTYDRTGQCIAIPTEGGACELAKEARVRAYPVEEHGGVIFGFLSDHGGEASYPCPRPDELVDPSWSGFIIPHHWANARWFRALENLVDPLHGPFLHTGTYTLGYGSRQDLIKVEERPDGFFVERAEQKLVNFDYAEYHFPNWFRIDIPYPWTAGPGGPMRILVYVTPIDANTTQVYMVRKRHITGWKWWLWWTLWQVRLRRKMWAVIDADEAVLSSQRGARALDNEFLAQSDMGIVRLRRMFTDALNAQQGRKTAE